eukprot:scaffold4589_cov106-Isochrysis_galbana.AAC.5
MQLRGSAWHVTYVIGGSRNWEDGRSTGKVFSGLRRMSEDSGAGTQPGSCGPQEGIPGASLDSSGSGRGPGSLMSIRPVARRRNRYTADLRAALVVGQRERGQRERRPCCAMSSPLTSAPHTDARSPRTARSKNWMIFRKHPTYRLPSAYRWYSVPTKRPEFKQAHAPEIFAIPAEDLREDKKSSQYLPSWDFRLLCGRHNVTCVAV